MVEVAQRTREMAVFPTPTKHVRMAHELLGRKINCIDWGEFDMTGKGLDQVLASQQER